MKRSCIDGCGKRERSHMVLTVYSLILAQPGFTIPKNVPTNGNPLCSTSWLCPGQHCNTVYLSLAMKSLSCLGLFVRNVMSCPHLFTSCFWLVLGICFSIVPSVVLDDNPDRCSKVHNSQQRKVAKINIKLRKKEKKKKSVKMLLHIHESFSMKAKYNQKP